MNAVELHDLTKIYNQRLIAVNGVNFTIPQGSVFGLIGSNGAGKTTTIRLILGLHRPTAGSVTVFGKPMSIWAGNLRRRIGFLSQTNNFPPDMTPIGYLDLIGKLFGVPNDERQARFSALLHAVDLISASSQRMANLSTGMMTRVGIAASLINDPDLVLWDEPTIGLDPTGRKYTLDLAKSLRAEGKTILLSTHILPDADQICDYLGVLNLGKVVFSGSVSEMKRLVQRNVVDLALFGDVDNLLYTISAENQGIQCERVSADVVRVSFQDGRDFSVDLTRMLEVVSRQGVEILSIRSAGEIEDAFLKRLEDDRNRGFSRAFENRRDNIQSNDSHQPVD